jgi:hypothetical protein
MATVLRPVDGKLRRIAAARTQIRVLDQICASHGWQTARKSCTEKWNQAFCQARSVFTPQRRAATLSERAARQENRYIKKYVSHASAQELTRGMERLCVSWSDGRRVDRWLQRGTRDTPNSMGAGRQRGGIGHR